jgi:light-regulated signal transduction histidine kinase (bacteriophytochrome)
MSDHAAPRFGEADLTNCEAEPIHVPGSIQPFAAWKEIVRLHSIAWTSTPRATSGRRCSP